ncbi:unnamed protein product [Ilex paraguariensis]|uniref:DNA (cytosine-5-)-methyltransferase n=1 Tax=Ilex paraguariensis TaxID=185542 RepID=A0ABC8TY58_9AQUA
MSNLSKLFESSGAEVTSRRFRKPSNIIRSLISSCFEISFILDRRKIYCQVGNAVAVPVGRALGYALGMAVQKLSGDEPLMRLPPKFSHSTTIQLQSLSSED